MVEQKRSGKWHGFIAGASCLFLPLAALPPTDSEFATVASWYGPGFQGRKTASGQVYDQNKMTAASRTLPFGTKVTVKNLRNGKMCKVVINDRGPYVRGREIDLSHEAARRLGIAGIAPVVCYTGSGVGHAERARGGAEEQRTALDIPVAPDYAISASGIAAIGSSRFDSGPLPRQADLAYNPGQASWLATHRAAFKHRDSRPWRFSHQRLLNHDRLGSSRALASGRNGSRGDRPRTAGRNAQPELALSKYSHSASRYLADQRSSQINQRFGFAYRRRDTDLAYQHSSHSRLGRVVDRLAGKVARLYKGIKGTILATL